MALAAIVGVPALAQAQLFPNAAIDRKRVPCCEEPPVYQTYRQQYYGYFPTCWRRFPPGWGCPSPDAPPPWDIVRRESPVRSERDIEMPSIDTMLPDGGTLPGGEIPLPPDTTSPFDMPGPAVPAAPDGAGLNAPPALGPDLDTPPAPAPAPAPQPPADTSSPFDLMPQPPAEPDVESVEIPPIPDLGGPDVIPVGVTTMPDSAPLPGPANLAPLNVLPPMEAGPGAPLPPEDSGRLVSTRAPRRGVVAGFLDRIRRR